MMKSYKALFLWIAILAMSALACQFGNSTATDAPAVANTPVPVVLMEDDFSDPASGWSSFSDEDGANDYLDGGYHLLVSKDNYYSWVNPGRSFSDVIIEVDGKKLAGPDENDYGVICRYVDDQNFYFFTIGSDGYYGVSKIVQGEESLIGMTKMDKNSFVIKGGDSTNHLKVTCKGSSLTLEVNGTILVDVLDTSLTTGDIGLIAGTYDTPGADVLFDNLVVTKP